MRCTTAPRCSKACAPMRRRAVRPSSGCAITRTACSIRRRSIASTFPSPKTRSITRCREVISQNGLARGAYLRPVAFRGYGEAGVVPKIDPPVEVAIAGWEWGKYLGAAEDEGVDVCVSSWQRVAPNTIPAMAKAGGNYLSSQLIGLEAKRLGFVEGIGLVVRWHRERRRRREPVPRQGRRALHAGRGPLAAHTASRATPS